MPVAEKIRQEQMAMPRIRDYALAQKRGNDIMGQGTDPTNYKKVQIKDFNNPEQMSYDPKFVMSPQINQRQNMPGSKLSMIH